MKSLRIKLLEQLLRVASSRVHSFYEASVTKMLAKFPFSVKDLAFLDPHNRSVTSVTGIVSLASRSTSYSTDEIDSLVMEFEITVSLQVINYLSLHHHRM